MPSTQPFLSSCYDEFSTWILSFLLEYRDDYHLFPMNFT